MILQSERFINFYQVKKKILIVDIRPASHSADLADTMLNTTHWMNWQHWKELDRFLELIVEENASSLNGSLCNMLKNWTGNLIKISFTFKKIRNWGEFELLSSFRNANSSEIDCLSDLIEEKVLDFKERAWKNALVVAVKPCTISKTWMDPLPCKESPTPEHLSLNSFDLKFPPSTEDQASIRSPLLSSSPTKIKVETSEMTKSKAPDLIDNGHADSCPTSLIDNSSLMELINPQVKNEPIDLGTESSSAVPSTTNFLESSIDLFEEEKRITRSTSKSPMTKSNRKKTPAPLSPVIRRKSLKRAAKSFSNNSQESEIPSKDVKTRDKLLGSPFLKNKLRKTNCSLAERIALSSSESLSSATCSTWLKKPQRTKVSKRKNRKCSIFDTSTSEDDTSPTLTDEERRQKFEKLRYFQRLAQAIAESNSLDISQSFDLDILEDLHERTGNINPLESHSIQQPVEDTLNKPLSNSDGLEQTQLEPTHLDKEFDWSFESQPYEFTSSTELEAPSTQSDSEIASLPDIFDPLKDERRTSSRNAKRSKLESDEIGIADQSQSVLEQYQTKQKSKSLRRSKSSSPKRKAARLVNSSHDNAELNDDLDSLCLRSKKIRKATCDSQEDKAESHPKNADSPSKSIAESTSIDRRAPIEERKEVPSCFGDLDISTKEDGGQIPSGSESEENPTSLPDSLAWLEETQECIGMPSNADESVICDSLVPHKGNNQYLKMIHHEFKSLVHKDYIEAYKYHLPLFRKLARATLHTTRSKLYHEGHWQKMEAHNFVKYMDEPTIEHIVNLTSHDLKNCIKNDCYLRTFAFYVLLPELHRRIMLEFPIVKQFEDPTEREFENYFEDLCSYF